MFIDILIYAVLAALLLYRLHGVLGTNGDSSTPTNGQNPYLTPGRPAEREAPSRPLSVETAERIHDEAFTPASIAAGLERIRAADPQFDEQRFLRGAEMAFRMIVEAFARGDRSKLRSLLNPSMYGAFDAAITARENDGLAQTTEVRRIVDTDIATVQLSGTQARIEVRIVSEQATVVRDRQGAVVDGDADAAVSITDLWSFERAVDARDPTWFLVATRTPDA